MTVIAIKAQTHSRFQKGPEITAADWSVVQWTFELSADKTFVTWKNSFPQLWFISLDKFRFPRILWHYIYMSANAYFRTPFCICMSSQLLHLKILCNPDEKKTFFEGIVNVGCEILISKCQKMKKINCICTLHCFSGQVGFIMKCCQACQILIWSP